MAQLSNLVLILGSGPNVGLWVAKTFAERGYKIALASRRSKAEEGFPNHQHFAADLSKPDSVVNVFSEVKKSLGIPTVVVYNAGAATPNNEKDPLSLELSAFERDLNINTTSAFVAAKQAAAGFAELPSGASKTFIYTGNILNVSTIPVLMDLGVGKSATAHMIRSAAAAYQDRGFKFYYADERKEDGAAAYHDINGEAHGKFYADLAGKTSQGPWQQTFVKGVGYKNFENLKL